MRKVLRKGTLKMDTLRFALSILFDSFHRFLFVYCVACKPIEYQQIEYNQEFAMITF